MPAEEFGHWLSARSPEAIVYPEQGPIAQRDAPAADPSRLRVV
jgi:hypothetical protein